MEIAVVGLVAYTTWGNAVIGMAPLPVRVWLFLLLFALTFLSLAEGPKWIQYRHAYSRVHA